MIKHAIPKEDYLDILDNCSDKYTEVTRITGEKHRWYTEIEIIVTDTNGDYWRAILLDPNSECQDGQDEFDDTILIKVKPYTKTITRYEALSG